MNTADIFSLLHLFHLFTFLWHRPTLSKRCMLSFKAVGLGLFPVGRVVYKRILRTRYFYNVAGLKVIICWHHVLVKYISCHLHL